MRTRNGHVALNKHRLRESRPRFSDGAPVRRVVALLRPGGSLERLQELPQNGDWSIEYADITNRLELRDLLGRVRPRVIMNLAGERHRASIELLETLFHGLAQVRGARLIHTSSAWVLPAGDRLDESVVLEPRSVHAEIKAQEDRLLPVLHEKTGVPWINLRLFNIFGKYEKTSRLLPYLVSSLVQGKVAELSSGDQVRDFNDVDDMARAYLLALQADESACGMVYHVGSGRGTKLRQFAMTVADVTGNAGLIRFGARETPDQDLPCLVADPARARQILQWSAPDDLEVRIRETAEWWLEGRQASTQAGPSDFSHR